MSTQSESQTLRDHFRQVERRQWWLWISAASVTLLLTAGIASFGSVASVIGHAQDFEHNLGQAVRGLVGLVLIFDIYATFQQLQIHRIRRALTAREELFRFIGENAADMIAVVDTQGRRLYNSPAYFGALGYSPDELQGTSSLEEVHPEDRSKVLEATKEAQRTGHGRALEYRIRHKDGSWRVFESTASAVKNELGQVEKLVIVNRDVTERKQLEQQLYLSQKLEAVGRLSGGVAHDFNNLLGVIIGYAEVLLLRLKDDAVLREATEEIYKAGKRAATLTSQLLAFSRKQVLEPTVLELNHIVADTEKMLRRLIGEDIELQTLLEKNLRCVKADRGQIEQVILNLAVNARDAMPQGGQLTIETANVQLDEKTSRQFPYVLPGAYIMLAVSDTGCGMDAATQAQIFEPFFTTKEKGKGTGLGLSTVYGVVKQSGGYIWVDSEPGKGARFRVYLPRVEEAPHEVREAKKAAARPQGSPAVLLVEDEDSLRKLTCNLLRDAGYTILEANNAAQALEMARAHNGPIHLLLTDVVMPGMSGAALAKQLLPQRPDMKVIYMSGYTDSAIATHRVLEPGVTLLRKPFTRDRLVKTVEEALFAVKG